MSWRVYLFLAPLGALTFGIAGGLTYATLRRAGSHRAARVVAWVAATLVVLSVVPAPLPAGASSLRGIVTSDTTIPVDADDDARATATDGGSARIVAGPDGGQLLVVACSTRCSFEAGQAGGRAPPYAWSVTFRDATHPTATLRGGEAEVYDGHATCDEAPVLFVALFGAFTCAPACRDVWRANGSGTVELRETGEKKCG